MLPSRSLKVPAAREDFFERPLNPLDRLLNQPAYVGIADLVAVKGHHLQRIAHVVIHVGDLLQPLLQKPVLFLGANFVLQEQRPGHQPGQSIAEQENAQTRYAFPEQQTVKGKTNAGNKYGGEEESESEPQIRFHGACSAMSSCDRNIISQLAATGQGANTLDQNGKFTAKSGGDRRRCS